MHILSGILNLLGSLGIFIFGMKVMSSGIQKIAGSKMRAIMSGMTKNRVNGVFTGFTITTLVQSSSASTVMVVSFVNAGLLTLTEAIGVIMGANLGTTTTFWLISFANVGKFSLSKIALPAIGIGLPLLFMKKARWNDIGESLIGFGLVFQGLSLLKKFVPDIKNNPETFQFVQNFSDLGVGSYPLFLLLGVVVTIIVQSSSAAGAITLIMASQGWIQFDHACAIVLGENIGTTITANLAAIGTTANAKRAALAHFFFNIAGVFWIMLVFKWLIGGGFVGMIDTLMPGNPYHISPENPDDSKTIKLHISLFHSLFNLANIILLIGFIPLLSKCVTKIIKDEKKTFTVSERMKYLSSNFSQTGEMNLAEAEHEIREFAHLTKAMFADFQKAFTQSASSLDEAVRKIKEREIHSDQLAFEISNYLILCSADEISTETTTKITSMLRVVDELEDICDCCARLAHFLEFRYRKQREFPQETKEEIEKFCQKINFSIDFYLSKFADPLTEADLKYAHLLENEIDEFRKNLRKRSVKRMQEKSDIKAEILYIDILNQMEKIGNHAYNVVEALARQQSSSHLY